jgi:hypothetical protein
MKSQVSFKFDGSFNQEFIVKSLKSKLTKMKYAVTTVGNNVYRIYVTSDDTKQQILRVCRGIQSNAIYDNKEL